MASQVEEFLMPETGEKDEDQRFQKSDRGVNVHYPREEGEWVDEYVDEGGEVASCCLALECKIVGKMEFD